MKMVEIEKDIYICGLALYLKKYKTLILADMHLGYEELLNEQGILMPRINFKEIKKEINGIFKMLKESALEVKEIVINGDLKHEFGEISKQEWREVLQMIDFLQKFCKKIVLIKGNHDNILGPLANKKNLEIVDVVVFGNIAVLHGHKILEDKIKGRKILIIAHEHPAVGIRENGRVERVKCFLKGKWRGKTLIVMPSLLSVTVGTDILQQKLLSPFLQIDLSNFEIFAVEDKIYYFGKVKFLREIDV